MIRCKYAPNHPGVYFAFRDGPSLSTNLFCLLFT